MPYVEYDPRLHTRARTRTTQPDLDRALGRGARRGSACKPQRKYGPRPWSVGRALSLQSRELWQKTKMRRSDLTRNDTASQLPYKTNYLMPPLTKN